MLKDSFKNKIRLIFSLFILITIIMAIRLYFLQIVDGEMYSQWTDRQYVNSYTEIFDRGSIFFQNKDGSLVSVAGLKTGYILAINPKEISGDTGEYYKKLSAILPLDAASFYSKVSKKDDPYEELATKISEEEIKKIDELDLPGLIIVKERWRYYPGDTLAARVVGFVGFDESGKNIEGRYGLERYYNDTLKRDENDLYMNTFEQIFSNIGKYLSQDREGNIITTIDPDVEGYADKMTESINKKWDSKLTGMIVINPNTGEIYAMSSYPTFNLNNFRSAKDISVFANPLVSDAYEMGSIVKSLTMAAGLDFGSVKAETTYDDKGFLKMDGATIYNFDKKGRGVVDMQTVLNNSLNTGATFVMESMGKEKFLEYMERFGIGQETGIDLPAEASGNIGNLLENLENDKKIEYATASFGQGISMTPIIMVRALSSLANGGKFIIPHVVKEIDYKVGLPKHISYVNEAKQILKKETSEEISRMLVKVVDEALMGGTVKMEDYSIAAKTGTAQIARPASEGGGYYSDKWLHSFFGYFPAYNPRFLVFLYTVEPKGVNYASQTLTDPFFEMTKYLINYYDIPPDR